MANNEYNLLKDNKYEGYSAVKTGPDEEENSVDDVAAYLPFWLKTNQQRWTAFFITTAMCGVASGPVGAWPTLEPVLRATGLFEGADQKTMLSTVYSLSFAASLATSLPAGWLYDRYGGRFCCFWGAIGAAVGLALMAAAVFFPKTLGWTMLIGYPFTMVAGQINTFGLYVFIWVLPEHQNLVSSTASGIQALSDMLALVAVGLGDCCGVFIGYFFLAVAFLSVLSGMVCWAYVPSKQVMLQVAGAIIHADAAAMHVEEVDDTCCGPEMKLVRESWRVMRKYSVANGLLLAFSTAYCISIIYPVQEMLYYYEAMFPKDTATDLVDAWAVIYGIGGFLCAVMGGALCDKVGICNFTMIVTGCCAFVVIMLPIPTWGAQIASQIGMTLGLSLYFIVINRFSMLYASPDLFGTLGGLQFSIVTCAMACMVPLLSLLKDSLAGESMATKYQAVFVTTGILSTLLGAALVFHWQRQPPPAPGDAAVEAAREAADPPPNLGAVI